MGKEISSKIVALTFGILAVSFLTVFYVVAWQEPTQTPPGGNVATPLNTSSTEQIKTGNLVVNALGITATSGDSLVINSGGNLCFGGECRSNWPATGIVTTYRTTVSSYAVDDSYYAAKTATFSCPGGASVSITYCKDISLYDSCQEVYNHFCSCRANGSTATLTAYAHQYKACTNYCYQKVVGSCGPYRTESCDTDCSAEGPCEMEFTCGAKETVGAYSAEECVTTDNLIFSGGGNCNKSDDDAQCNSKCTAVGWVRGGSVTGTCTPNLSHGQRYSSNTCGISYSTGDNQPSTDHHLGACRCSN